MSFILNPYRYAGFVNANSLSFDGTNEYVDFGNDSSLDFDYNTPFSFSAWIYTDSLGSSQMIMQKQDSTIVRGYQFLLFPAGELRLTLFNSSTVKITVLSTGTLSANTWYQVGFTYDGSGNGSGVTIYVDGSSYASSITADTLGTNTISNTVNLIIGQNNSSVYFDGYIDEVSVWNKELTSGEVSDIYNSGCPNDLNSHSAYANLVSWWRMGEGDTISSITDQIDKKYLSFDGTNEYVDCGNDSSLDFDYNEAMSYGGWLYTTSLSSVQIFLARLSNASPFKGYQIQVLTSGKLRCTYINDASTNRLNVDTTTALSINTWYHIMVTKSTSSSASGVKIYINGVSDTLTVNADNLSSSYSQTLDFNIGAKNNNSSLNQPFSGYIDEVSVWDKELSSTEVTALYDEGRYNPKYEDLSFVANGVSYWKMGEDDTISSITDQFGSNDGTPQNMDSSNLIDANNTGTPQNMDSSNITTETPC